MACPGGLLGCLCLQVHAAHSHTYYILHTVLHKTRQGPDQPAWRSTRPNMPSMRPVAKASVSRGDTADWRTRTATTYHGYTANTPPSSQSRLPPGRESQACDPPRPGRSAPDPLGSLLQPSAHCASPRANEIIRSRCDRRLRLDTVDDGLLTQRRRADCRPSAGQGRPCQREEQQWPDCPSLLRLQNQPRHCPHAHGSEAAGIGAHQGQAWAVAIASSSRGRKRAHDEGVAGCKEPFGRYRHGWHDGAASRHERGSRRCGALAVDKGRRLLQEGQG
ncbi:hypothetical protein T440DRAFT_93509 [Plenodomus tracheiphilus IPT5]|uniref:Uncharacterized protein n=1 Tax=Plenodomus tracheiphilus IPT5 TaxID=1408161 RepID=A0A6A7BKA2_9PLEO|nr:hypothetical protein T440DRAFT_93509 [Plenodomus tracheiphilus IPT5]